MQTKPLIHPIVYVPVDRNSLDVTAIAATVDGKSLVYLKPVEQSYVLTAAELDALIEEKHSLLYALKDLEEYVRRELIVVHGATEKEVDYILKPALEAIEKASPPKPQ